MKKYIIGLCVILFTFNMYAQISEGGSPMSWEENNLNKVHKEYSTVGIDFEISEYRKNEYKKHEVLKFAEVFDVAIDIKESGQFNTLVNKGNLWRLKIKSDNAYSINLIFDKYQIPEGAKLFLFNEDKTDIKGAFTHKNIKKFGGLATAPISGDVIIVEYFEPFNASFEGTLIIGKIGHDYTGAFGLKDENFGESDYCHIDINCDEGKNWQTEKRAVCRMIINGGTLCTGTLINNTAKDQTPYVLSANHCIYTNYSAQNTVFTFNYESPACSGNDGFVSESISGAELVSATNNLDFLLLKLSENVPASYKPYFAGWDLQKTPPQKTVGIHHPWGDVKKISMDNHAPEIGSNWDYDRNSFWKVLEWDAGTTEGGSSGSPLFNEKHRIIGTLTGDDGDPNDCEKPINDFYQMISSSYDTYPNSEEQLKTWLDPLNLGQNYLDGYDPSNDFISNKTIVTNWTPDQELSFYVANDGGYLSGNNAYMDKAKAEYFKDSDFLGRNAITGAYIAFVYAKGNNNQQIELQALSEKDGFPDQILGTSKVSLEKIKEKVDKDFVYFGFFPPIDIEGSVFLSVVLPQVSGDTIAILTADNAETNTAWELNYNNNWVPYSDNDNSWGINLAHLIGAEVANYKPTSSRPKNNVETKIFPNPANDKLNVSSTENIISLSIYNTHGQVIKHLSHINSKNTTFDVNQLKKGFYILTIQTQLGVYSKKVIIE